MSRSTGVVAVLAVVGVVFAVSSPELDRSARLQDQVEALQDDAARTRAQLRELESTSSALTHRLSSLEKRIAVAVPDDIRVVPLVGGGTERWSLPSGPAYVQFLRLGDDGTPVFTIKNGAGNAETGLRAGESHVAVDDRGSEQRVHTTSLHRILRDRTGAPAEGLVSVTFEVRTP